VRNYELTPGAQRALAFAARWTSEGRAGELEPAELLLGLLEEPECRGALLLAASGIGIAEVRQRWPELRSAAAQDPSRAGRLSPALSDALLAAELRLADYPRPLELATEHLLLGLAAGENEVAAWFRERGLNVDALESEIHRLAGHRPGPLPIEADLPADVPPREQAPAEVMAALRIIDAAANRAGEGLRVVEDYSRFALDDRFLTAECKSLRHELTAALAVYPTAGRLAARETREDVGVDLKLDSEQTRDGLGQVVAAAWQRLQQALRSLEEYSKTLEPIVAGTLESLRYRAYTLERALGIAAHSGTRLADARLYVLVDGRESAQDFNRLIGALVSAGADVIQLRDKRLADRELTARGRLLRERTRGTKTLFVMNDRPDLALLCQADGVHVGQDEMTVKDARSIVGPERLVGLSTHSIEQARAAVLAGADYIGVGPTFASRTKHFNRFPGLELLGQVSAEIGLPAFAVGGITRENVAQVRQSGFSRIAVSGAVLDSAEPRAAVIELRRALVGQS
jgi:thiamine-phosphate pyrophosphorylase